jgi:hypothetical protein
LIADTIGFTPLARHRQPQWKTPSAANTMNVQQECGKSSEELEQLQNPPDAPIPSSPDSLNRGHFVYQREVPQGEAIPNPPSPNHSIVGCETPKLSGTLRRYGRGVTGICVKKSKRGSAKIEDYSFVVEDGQGGKLRRQVKVGGMPATMCVLM